MTRHQDQQRVVDAERRECLQHQLLFTFARTRRDPHGPRADRRAPRMTPRRQFRRRAHIELQIAEHRDITRTECGQPLRIRWTLRQHPRKSAKHVLGGMPELGGALVRARRHPRIGQHKRHVRATAFVDQRRPHFGFHHQTKRRPPRPQKPPHRVRHVIRQIAAQYTVAENFLASGAAARRHMRQKNPRVGPRLHQRVDERLRGARLAHRHRVHPDQRRIVFRQPAARVAETLGDMLAIAPLLARPDQQAQHGERRDDPPEPVINRPQHRDSARSGANPNAKASFTARSKTTAALKPAPCPSGARECRAVRNPAAPSP